MKISNIDSLSTMTLNAKGVPPADEADVVSNSQAISGEPSETASEKMQAMVIDDEMLEKSIEQANKSLEGYNRYIERSVHEKTKAIMYVMKDSSTNEVIREFPPKKIQDMIAKMWELAGLFVDERA